MPPQALRPPRASRCLYVFLHVPPWSSTVLGGPRGLPGPLDATSGLAASLDFRTPPQTSQPPRTSMCLYALLHSSPHASLVLLPLQSSQASAALWPVLNGQQHSSKLPRGSRRTSAHGPELTLKRTLGAEQALPVTAPHSQPQSQSPTPAAPNPRGQN